MLKKNNKKIANINEKNNNQEESDNREYEDCEDKTEAVPDFDSFASLEKKFTIKTMPGDGNCLFNSLSYLIFETSDYNGIIRQKYVIICLKLIIMMMKQTIKNVKKK